MNLWLKVNKLTSSHPWPHIGCLIFYNYNNKKGQKFDNNLLTTESSNKRSKNVYRLSALMILFPMYS